MSRRAAEMTAAERVGQLASLLGRTEDQVEELLVEGRAILLEWGRQHFYSEFNRELAARTGQPAFDLSLRNQIGGLLGEISRLELPEIERVTGKRALLSVLVWLKRDAADEGDEFGVGFYDLTEELVGLPGGKQASQADKDRSIVFQHRSVEEYIDAIRPSRRRRGR